MFKRIVRYFKTFHRLSEITDFSNFDSLDRISSVVDDEVNKQLQVYLKSIFDDTMFQNERNCRYPMEGWRYEHVSKIRENISAALREFVSDQESVQEWVDELFRENEERFYEYLTSREFLKEFVELVNQLQLNSHK